MKRIFSIFLALVFAFSFALTSAAESSVSNPDIDELTEHLVIEFMQANSDSSLAFTTALGSLQTRYCTYRRAES